MRKNPVTLGFLALFSIACLMASLSASAMSIHDYEATPIAQRSQYLVDAINKKISDAKDPKTGQDTPLSIAIRSYFSDPPPAEFTKKTNITTPLGYVDFGLELVQTQDAAKSGQLDLRQIQIEDILDDVIQTKVAPKLTKTNTAPAKP